MADEQDCTTAGGCGEAVDPTRLPHEKLEEMQLEGVRRTLVNCYEHIPFYKRSFDEAGFDPYHLASLDDLANAPFVTKQDLRDAAPYGMLAVPLSWCLYPA